ncbi:MAG: potassium-transporting ATPase subunit KdpC [Pirellulales bacterium]|nr:potassium-transporting ATPase subunit KdpC [Pirellulales bacterium]
MKTLRQSILLFLVLTIVTGVVYPLAMTCIAQLVFSHRANGSWIERHGTRVGSEFIGQQFDGPRYFWGRPSACGYNSAASNGSNAGPTNPVQLAVVRDRVVLLQRAHPEQSRPVPVDLVTASGSGLDPHISPAAAEFQVVRVAKARSLEPAKVRELVSEQTEGRTFGVLGEPRVNVLKLNLALDNLR